MKPEIKWSIVKLVNDNFNLKNGCALCNTERFTIANSDQDKLLNKWLITKVM